MRASLRCCLTSISTLIVSGTKLARRREMVSLPPEKIRSTATAEPKWCRISLNWNLNSNSLTWDRKYIADEAIEVWELWTSSPTTSEGVCNARNPHVGVWDILQSRLPWSYPSFGTAKWSLLFLVNCWHYLESVPWLKTSSGMVVSWSQSTVKIVAHNAFERKSSALILSSRDRLGGTGLMRSLI